MNDENDENDESNESNEDRDEVDADLLTLARDLGGQMKRQTGGLRIVVPPIETVVRRSGATARRSRLLAAAAVIAVVVLAAGVIRLAGRPQTIDVGQRDEQQTFHPVTLDPSSGWRVSVALPGDPGDQVTSGLPYFASGPDGWPNLLIMPQSASRTTSAPTATDPISFTVPSIATAEPQQMPNGGLSIEAVLDGGLQVTTISYGLSKEQLVASLRGMNASTAADDLVVPGLPDGMSTHPFGMSDQLIKLSTDGIATGTAGTTFYLTQVHAADIRMAATQQAMLQAVSTESLTSRTTAGRSIVSVRDDTNLVIATPGPEPGTSVVVWAPARLDDAAVDQIVGAIRPLSLDEWHGLQERCPPEKPCS